MEKQKDFFTKAREIAEQLKERKSPSTCTNYQTALRSLHMYAESRQITVGNINQELIEAYFRWLRDKPICLNTISCYMRSLRSLYRQLGGKENIFHTVFTGTARTEKRAIEPSDIRKLCQVKLKSGSQMELVRDIFVFSTLAMGMPLVDVAFLNKDNVADGYITYMRHKTHQTVRVPIEKCHENIMLRYASSDSPYVFPIITATDATKAHRQYRNFLSFYNRMLKKLAAQAGIAANLSSYVVRHTWASTAYSQNIDISVISKALGHTNIRTTQIYISEINDDRVKKANRALLDTLLKDSNGDWRTPPPK